MDYYPRYIGDYRKRTGHLTPREHGVYNLLMDHYYQSEMALPLADHRLFAICNVSDDDDKAAVKFVLAQFFVKRDDGYHKDRIEEVIEKYGNRHRERSAAGKKGAMKRWSKDARANGSATGSGHNETMAFQSSKFKEDLKPEGQAKPSDRVEEMAPVHMATAKISEELCMSGYRTDYKMRAVLEKAVIQCQERFRLPSAFEAADRLIALRKQYDATVECRAAPMKFFAEGIWSQAPWRANAADRKHSSKAAERTDTNAGRISAELFGVDAPLGGRERENGNPAGNGEVIPSGT